MSEETIYIPMYFNFSFWCIACEKDHLYSRGYYSSIRSFWERNLSDVFKEEVRLYDIVFDFDNEEFGIPILACEDFRFRYRNCHYPLTKIIENRLTIEKGQFRYKPHNLDSVIKSLEREFKACDKEDIECLVTSVNAGERKIFERLCDYYKSDKRWNYLRSEFLTHGYLWKKLKKEVKDSRFITDDLIETERLLIKTKRELFKKPQTL